MRGATLALLTMLPTAALGAAAEDVERGHPASDLLRTELNNSITICPIDLFTGQITVQYERTVFSRLGIYVGANALVLRGILLPSDTQARFAVGPELGFRVYVYGRAPAGIWVGPYANALYVRNVNPARDPAIEQNNLALGAGGMAGINLLFGQFNLSLGAGAGYQDYGVLTRNARPSGSSGVSPRLRLAVGAVF